MVRLCGDALFREETMSKTGRPGKVYLVGAGPGDPRLITLRGAECLAIADLVLYDGLVNPLLLQLTNGICERTARIRRASGASIVPQSKVNDRLIAAARDGLTVVRLKGGDPYIFGRGSEEAHALQQAGVDFEVVPGITAATAAGEYAGFSFTHRGISSAVAFVTGHEDPSREASRLDYAALAAFPGTLVFYMGLSRLQQITEQLIDSGLPDGTPAAVVCRASLPGQQVAVSTLKDLPVVAAAEHLQPPSLIVIGECVRQRDALNWFERMPLFGRSIGVIRPAHQIAEVADQVVAMGGEPVPLPLLELQPLSQAERNAAVCKLTELPRFDWLVFTSANAVREFHALLWDHGYDARCLGQAQIAVVGNATASTLVQFGLRADVIPQRQSADDLMDEIESRVAGRHVLWLRGREARDTIRLRMQQCEAHLDELIIYDVRESVDLSAVPVERLAASDVRALDWVAIGSAAAATAYVRLCHTAGIPPSDTPRLAVISPHATSPLLAAGYTVDAIATSASWPSILNAIAACD
jgi:uroporphyrinogen III methyltransferase/synthase